MTTNWRENVGRANKDSHRVFCAALGWPEVVIPAHARILHALERGPQSHREIVKAMGHRIPPNHRGRPTTQRRIKELMTLRYVEAIPGKGRQILYQLSGWIRARREES